jgi:hypothetical protein
MIQLSLTSDILQQATAIVSFRCTLLGPSAVPRALPPLVHLQSLILRNATNVHGAPKQLLDALTAPALRHLSISARELGGKPISPLITLFSRSHCSLDSLHVSHSAHGTDYRAAFPSIKVIKVLVGAEKN